MEINELKNILDVDGFMSISKALNSKSNEDVNIALENISNIKPDPVFHFLFLKLLSNKDRDFYVKFMNDKDKTILQPLTKGIPNIGNSNRWYNFWDDETALLLKNLHKTVKESKNPIAKQIFKKICESHVASCLTGYEFIEAKLNIKW
jgi:hypothetical protein|tara:strand:+ start:1376 stop:1819 length:444 start_codon:yes stop_codon:yes gene_type:complete